MSAVNTAQAERRKLRFETIDECLAEVDRIVASERAGSLRRTGNWTTGQIFAHVAAWIDYGYDGYPLGPPPWPIRMILKLLVGKYLRKGMPAGVRIPKTEHGTFGMDAVSTEDGAKRIRDAFGRLKRGEHAKFDSPAFGPMSHEDRVQLNLRHAELHLGFLHL